MLRFFPGVGDELLFERVLRRSGFVFVVHAEPAGPGFEGQFEGGQLVGRIVTGGVLGRSVVFLQFNGLVGTAFARDGGVEGAFEKLDAFGEDFDDREAVVVRRAEHHLDHVVDLRGMGASDEGGAAVDERAHRIDGLVEGAPGVGLGFEAERRGGRCLLFRQAVNGVIHDDVGHAWIFAGGVDEVVAADGEAVAVSAEDEDMQIVAAETDASGKGERAAVDVMAAVGVDEIREARRTTDAGERDDFFLRVIEFLEDLVEGGEDGEVAAAGAPRRVVGGEGFLGERRTRCVGAGGVKDGGGHGRNKSSVRGYE